jgi:hypothetical protein
MKEVFHKLTHVMLAFLLWPKHALERRRGKPLGGWAIPLILLWWGLLLHVLVWSAFGLVCSSMLVLSVVGQLL